MKKHTTYTLTVLLVMLAAGAGLYLWWAWKVTSRPSVQMPPQGQPTRNTKSVFEAPGKFTIMYPMGFQATTGTGLGGANLDTSYVSIALPDGLFATSGTNYVEAYLVLSSSTSSNALGSCLSFSDITDQTSGAPSGTDINGVAFKRTETEGAAAGNSYHSKLYRAVYEGACYEAALVVHTGNVGNYDPPVTEFDQSKAFDKLNAILQTFRFE